MKKPAERYGKASTTDLMLLVRFRDALCLEYLRVCAYLHTIHKTPTTAHKQLLGRQDHCWIGGSQNRKFFIWRIEELWVLVHNEKGVVLEVPADTSEARALVLWEHYKRMIGFSLSKWADPDYVPEEWA